MFEANVFMESKSYQFNIDSNTKFAIAHFEVIIKNDPDAIWEYAYNPKTWTESNAEEHLGLVFYNDINRPQTGVGFYQKETVGGVYSDLHGHILWAERPKMCIWLGVGKYKLFGFVPLDMPVSGVIELEPTSNGTRMSHTLYGRYPDSLLGKIFFSSAKKYMNKANYIPHAYKELLYFKDKLDKSNPR